MKRLRIAVAGVGAIGCRHIELVLADRNCSLAAIVDPASSAGEVAAKAGVPLFSSLADLFACERSDGVILATPNNLHLEHGLACIAAGVLALIEKPIADSIEAGQRLCDAAANADWSSPQATFRSCAVSVLDGG